jgi:hypothetical protein
VGFQVFANNRFSHIQPKLAMREKPLNRAFSAHAIRSVITGMNIKFDGKNKNCDLIDNRW